MPETGIYISYRRVDTSGISGRIQDHLGVAFGEENVFLDVNSIPGGAKWMKFIERKISQSAVVLAIIGPGWLTVTENDGSSPRLRNPVDPLRHELEYAHKKRRPVIPVCINETPVPTQDQLPESLRWLPGLHAQRIYDSDFDYGISGLIKALEHQGLQQISPVTHPRIPFPPSPIPQPPGWRLAFNKLIDKILGLIATLGIIVLIGWSLYQSLAKKNEISASQTPEARYLGLSAIATDTQEGITPPALATSTILVIQRSVQTPTQTVYPTIMNAPKPVCVDATVESIQLFLDNSWKNFYFEDGTHIGLTRNDTSGLTRMVGRAVFTDPNVPQNCICSWEGGTMVPYKDLSMQANDCSFSNPLAGTEKHLFLILRVGGNPLAIVIDFP